MFPPPDRKTWATHKLPTKFMNIAEDFPVPVIPQSPLLELNLLASHLTFYSSHCGSNQLPAGGTCGLLSYDTRMVRTQPGNDCVVALDRGRHVLDDGFSFCSQADRSGRQVPPTPQCPMNRILQSTVAPA